MKRRNLQHLQVPETNLSADFTSEDNTLDHLEFGAGFAPYTRGIHTTMYVTKPWTIRQYAGFSSAEESNLFYKKNLANGQTGLSLAFDLATHRGYDSDHPRVQGDVGKTGVAIDSVEDMKILFNEIPLDQISVSMTMNGAVLPILAFYIVAAEEKGINQNLLSGTIQNDILKEFMVRNAYIYPPKASMRIIADIFEYICKYMPRFNPISISGYHMQEAGATPEMELAFTIANGIEYVRTGIKKGIDIDFLAPRLSFFWGISTHHFTEIAKLRAARMLWATQMKQFKPKNEKSLMLRTHCQTSGWSLTEQLPYNNITRTTVEAMSAILGGTQSLHTNSFDEAIALPTEFSSRIAINTQLILRDETKITKTVDPWAGSHVVEQQTHDLYDKALDLIHTIENMGGMTQAIEKGFPNQMIEKAALLKQTRIENQNDYIVGVNTYRVKNEKKVTYLEVDTDLIRTQQIKKLTQLKHDRDNSEVEKSLKNITHAATQSNINLLEIVIHAARKRATLGEISLALESVFGRHQAKTTLNTGVFDQEMANNTDYILAKQLVAQFVIQKNRNPILFLAKLGQDGHDRGAKVVGSSYTDIGFKVHLGELFLTPIECAQRAIDLQVDCIGVSSLAGGHKTLVPELIEELKRQQSNIPVFIGGVIPKDDYTFLYEKKVTHIFGPGYPIAQSAITILQSLIS